MSRPSHLFEFGRINFLCRKLNGYNANANRTDHSLVPTIFLFDVFVPILHIENCVFTTEFKWQLINWCANYLQIRMHFYFLTDVCRENSKFSLIEPIYSCEEIAHTVRSGHICRDAIKLKRLMTTENWISLEYISVVTRSTPWILDFNLYSIFPY